VSGFGTSVCSLVLYLESHTNRPQGYMACAVRVATVVNVSMWMSTSVRGLAASYPPAHPLLMPTHPNSRGKYHSRKDSATKKMHKKKRAQPCVWGCAQRGGRSAVKSAVFGILTGRVSASRRSSPPRPEKILLAASLPPRQKFSSSVASRSNGQIVTCCVTVEDIVGVRYIRTDSDSPENSSRACAAGGASVCVVGVAPTRVGYANAHRTAPSL
jgi:hypothetical protein